MEWDEELEWDEEEEDPEVWDEYDEPLDDDP